MTTTTESAIDRGDLLADIDRALSAGGAGLDALLARYDARPTRREILEYIADCLVDAQRPEGFAWPSAT